MRIAQPPSPEGFARICAESVKALARLFLSTLREIFDESAYRRFLSRTGCECSTESYEIFMREHLQAKEQRPKCC